MKITLKFMWNYVGGLSEPSKMPCYGYSIPAAKCGVGSRLRKVADSTCKFCYALKGRYVFENVQKAMYNRLESLYQPLWVEYMSTLINHYGKKSGYFRWHDSGDIQDIKHLRNIVQVCLKTPNIQHWIPTREFRIVQDYLKEFGPFPDNLTVRLSAHMIEGTPPQIEGTVGSSVHRSEPKGKVCPAPKQDNACGPCRSCWDRTVPLVSYPIH